MPGPLVVVTATIQCPHGGRAIITPSSPRVRAGAPVAVLTDTTIVAGCPFMVGTKPQPCLRVQWTVGAARVRAGGKPVLVQTSTGLCLSAEGIPQGAPIIIQTQMRARGM